MYYCLTISAQILPILVILYFYFKRKFSHWSNRGINGPTPLPLIGNMWEWALKGQATAEMEWSTKYGKVYGMYIGSKPYLSLMDSELIKQVMVKDFNLFVNRLKLRNYHKVWSRNMFNLENDDWKRVRAITSPSFTTGKLKSMTALMNVCIGKMNSYLDGVCTSGDGLINTKEVVSGFTIDVIAATSFATDTNVNDRRAASNPVVGNAINLMGLNAFRVILLMLTPTKILNYLEIPQNFAPKQFRFFHSLLSQVVRQRKEEQSGGAKRNDLVQLMVDAAVSDLDLNEQNYDKLTASIDEEEDNQIEISNNQKDLNANKIVKKLTDNEIIAQCILFFAAGFETTANTIAYCLFELAKAPEIQNRLCEEIEQALTGMKVNSTEHFETVMGQIPYLDAVIKETLRKYPPLLRVERFVSVDGYKIAGVTLNKYDSVSVPVYAVHHNAEYYPEPEHFKPDRFMPENKHLLVPYTYLPFGHGPRNCVGMQFAYQEMKLLLAQMIPRFSFSPTVGTPDKIQFANINLLGYQPFPLKVNKR